MDVLILLSKLKVSVTKMVEDSYRSRRRLESETKSQTTHVRSAPHLQLTLPTETTRSRDKCLQDSERKVRTPS